MEEQRVTIKFDGESHQVPLATFTKVLLDYSMVVKAAAKASGTQGAVDVSIVATETGSLDAVISVAAQAAGGLLSFLRDNKDGIEAAVIVAAAVYEFKQKIAGKTVVTKIDETPDGSSVTVRADGETVEVDARAYKVYVNSPDAAAAINSSFCALEETPDVTGIQMTYRGGTMFRAEREEFSGIASSPNYEGPGTRHIREEEILQVVKPCLVCSKSRKWEFLLRGIKISASISDEMFLNRLETQRFGLGTMMRVLLDVTQEYDAKRQEYACTKFVVMEVREVFDPPVTEPMF